MERNLDLYPDEMTDNERAVLASQDVGKYLGSLNKNVIFEVIVRCLSSLCAQISPEERDVCSHELPKDVPYNRRRRIQYSGRLLQAHARATPTHARRRSSM